MRDRKKTKRFIAPVFPIAVLFAVILFAVPGSARGGASFSDKFNQKRVINEAGSMDESASPHWWVNSGGKMIVRGGVGQTVQKDLSKKSKWCKLYKKTNSGDTDGGKHPQNIFRLLTKTSWQDFSQQAYFRIRKTNKSESENRNESNGILLMSRYRDSDNLYYAGVRVDGYAVIKKKLNGEYFTLAYEKFYGGKKYDRKSRPSLLPKKKSIGLKTEVRDIDGGKVEINLFVANGRKGKWVLAASAVDEGDVISGAGYAGIRTDFMDVEFDKYATTEL